MPQWATFVGITGVVLVLLLVLSHLTQSAFTDGEPDSSDGPGASADGTTTSSQRPLESASDSGGTPAATDRDSTRNARSVDGPATATSRPNGSTAGVSNESAAGVSDESAAGVSDESTDGIESDDSSAHRETTIEGDERRPTERGVDPGSLSTGMVLANVAFSQGLFALVLLGAAVYTAIPASALGIEFSLAYLETGLLLGAAAGVVFTSRTNSPRRPRRGSDSTTTRHFENCSRPTRSAAGSSSCWASCRSSLSSRSFSSEQR